MSNDIPQVPEGREDLARTVKKIVEVKLSYDKLEELVGEFARAWILQDFSTYDAAIGEIPNYLFRKVGFEYDEDKDVWIDLETNEAVGVDKKGG